MNIAIVGCGFVSDYYMKTITLHPELRIVGAMDRIPARAKRFAKSYDVPSYPTLTDLLADDQVELVLNLTNPSSHYEVTNACLHAGKHVYSEKPLAMDFVDAKKLAECAERQNLHVSVAPCSILNETAQTVWKALRENVVGPVRLVYAEMDDGMVHLQPYKKWVSETGIPWPYEDEFEVGCTIEHAGYVVTWLVAYFGPAESVTAFSSCRIPDKQTDVPISEGTPDFSVACIKFKSGVVARLTCSIVAPHDHSMKFIGDNGVLFIDDCWQDRGPVFMRKRVTIRRKTILSPFRKTYPLAGKSNPRVKYRGAQSRNFARGVSELAAAIREKRSSRLSIGYCLHVCELVLAIHNAFDTGAPYRMTTSFEKMEPMPYATG